MPVVLRKLAAGQHLTAEAWDRANTAKIGTGTLATVDNQIDPTTGSLRLRADFDNAKNQLFPNQFVNVRLLVEEKRGVTLVPTAVIQRTTNSTYVYVVKDDHTVTVTPGHRWESPKATITEITSGVAPGDVLVMTGVDKLAEGTPVTVQMADAAPGAGRGGGGGRPGSHPGGKKK